MAIGLSATMEGDSADPNVMADLNDLDQGQPQPHQYPHRRHHYRPHHNKMRMHDVTVKKLADCDAELDLSPVRLCSCDNQENMDKIGRWGATNLICRSAKSKKQNAKRTKGSAGSQTNTYGLFTRGEISREDDCFRFRHYDDTSLFMQQYREENTICIQGADPCGPPVLGRDTPDPYIAKIRQCGDLLERLMTFTQMSREQTDGFESSRIKEDRLLKSLQTGDRCRSDTSSPESAGSSARSCQRGRSINLAPVRDCRLAVKNIKFPQAVLPKKKECSNLVSVSHLELPTPPKAPFPVPVKIFVESESMKGNKLMTMSPPSSPPRPKKHSVMRSESLERSHYTQKFPLSKKRSEGDLRCPPCPKNTLVTTDLSFSDPNLYRQYLAQRRKLIKAETTGHFMFGNQSTGGRENKSRTTRKESSSGAPGVGLCELYSSSSSGALITAANNN